MFRNKNNNRPTFFSPPNNMFSVIRNTVDHEKMADDCMDSVPSLEVDDQITALETAAKHYLDCMDAKRSAHRKIGVDLYLSYLNAKEQLAKLCPQTRNTICEDMRTFIKTNRLKNKMKQKEDIDEFNSYQEFIENNSIEAHEVQLPQFNNESDTELNYRTMNLCASSVTDLPLSHLQTPSQLGINPSSNLNPDPDPDSDPNPDPHGLLQHYLENNIFRYYQHPLPNNFFAVKQSDLQLVDAETDEQIVSNLINRFPRPT